MTMDRERRAMLQVESGAYESIQLERAKILVRSGKATQVADGVYRMLTSSDMAKQGEEYIAKIPFGD